MADKILLLPSPTPSSYHRKSSCSCATWTLILMILGVLAATIFVFLKYNVEFENLGDFGFIVVLIPKSVGFNAGTVLKITELVAKIFYKLI